MHDRAGYRNGDFDLRSGGRCGRGGITPLVDLDALAKRWVGHADAKNVASGKFGRDGHGHLFGFVPDAAIESDVVEGAVADGSGICRTAGQGAVAKIKRIGDLPLLQWRRTVVAQDSIVDEKAG